MLVDCRNERAVSELLYPQWYHVIFEPFSSSSHLLEKNQDKKRITLSRLSDVSAEGLGFMNDKRQDLCTCSLTGQTFYVGDLA